MRIIITGLSVAAAAMMVIACQSVATADVTLYLNYTVGEPFQEAQEALFLGARDTGGEGLHAGAC